MLKSIVEWRAVRSAKNACWLNCLKDLKEMYVCLLGSGFGREIITLHWQTDGLSHFTGRKKDHDTPLVDREIMTLHW